MSRYGLQPYNSTYRVYVFVHTWEGGRRIPWASTEKTCDQLRGLVSVDQGNKGLLALLAWDPRSRSARYWVDGSLCSQQVSTMGSKSMRSLTYQRAEIDGEGFLAKLVASMFCRA